MYCKREELSRMKYDYDALLKQEKDRSNGLEKSFKKALTEKKEVEDQLKEFYNILEQIESKLKAKNEELEIKQSEIDKLVKQVSV